MAMLSFNANEVEPSTGFDPIPVGPYPAIIIESEMKQTKDGGGEYLQLTFEIVGDKFAGRRMWARMNLKNKSETAVKIAKAELSAICRAVGIMTPTDSAQLHNIPLMIEVAMENGRDGELRNKIKKYSEIAGPAPSAPVIAQTASAKPPWKK